MKRVTPLQYEEIDGTYYIGSARGVKADWFRNLQVDPKVEIQIKGKRFNAVAEAITDPIKIADFFQVRLERHPFMIGLLMRLEGLPFSYNRKDLEKFAVKKEGGVRAKSLHDSRDEAEIALPPKGYFIEHRPGSRTRCESYCQVSAFCSQYQNYLSTKETNVGL